MFTHKLKIIAVTKFIVEIFIILLIAMLLVYSGLKIYELSTALFEHRIKKIVHDIAYFIVLIKAYKVLLSYLEQGSVGIRYIMEISIIAPSLEVIFAFDTHDAWTNIFLGAFSLITLFLYLLFFDRISMLQYANNTTKNES